MEPLAPDDPRQLGGYRLHARLGAGGMGQVYLGYSPAGRAVAVKVVRTDLARDPEFRARFRREAAAAAAVSGAYTAPVTAAGPDDDPPWLATVFVAGPSLADAVDAAGPLPASSAWKLAAGLAEALAAVHAVGLVHRDLKPSNVLLASDGPRVIDFGISHALANPAMTSSGQIVGTPSYMSPEQAQGTRPGPASDVFSLGSVIAFAATGRPPFDGGQLASVLYRIVHAAPALDGVPSGLAELAGACLAKQPQDRPRLGELVAAIAAVRPPDEATMLETFWPAPVTALIRAHQEQLSTQLRASRPALSLATPAPPPAPLPALFASAAPGPGATTAAGPGAESAAGPGATAATWLTEPAAPAAPYLAAAGPAHEPLAPGPAPDRAPALPPRAASADPATIGSPLAGAFVPADTVAVPRRPVRRRLVLAGLAAVAVGGAAGGGWELTRPGHPSRASPAAGSPGSKQTGSSLARPGTLAWQHVSPAVGTVTAITLVDGFLLAGSPVDGKIGATIALRAADGSHVRDFASGGPYAQQPGVVYLGGIGNVYACQASATFTLDWGTPTGHGTAVAGIAATSEGIYVSNYDGTLTALDTNGTPRWSGQPGSGTVAVSGTGLVFLVTVNGTLEALHASNSKRVWQASVGAGSGPGNGASGLAVGPGLLYVAGGHSVTALRISDGTRAWRYPTAAPFTGPGVTLADGTVYVGDSFGVLHAIDAASGQSRWTFRGDSAAESGVVVAGGTAYFGTNSGSVYAVDTASGTQRWHFQGNSDVQSQLVIANGRLYGATANGTIFALHT